MEDTFEPDSEFVEMDTLEVVNIFPGFDGFFKFRFRLIDFTFLN